MKRKIKIFIVSTLVEILFRILSKTWRIQEEPYPKEALDYQAKGNSLVCAHWHQDEWALLAVFAGRNMAVLVSESEDGSAMARLLSRMGLRVLRGSSSKSAVRGFLQLLRTVKREKIEAVSLAVDGPRGPRHEPKEGIVKLGEVLGGPLMMGAAVADRAWVFHRSWSQAFVPKPFARVVITYSLGENSIDGVKSALANCKQRARDLLWT